MRSGPEPGENLQRAVGFIEAAAKKGANVVCLPELFRTQYFCQREDAALFDLAESVPGPTTEAISQAARANGVAVVSSVVERRAPGIYHNTAVMIDADGALRGPYPEMHTPEHPLSYETHYF